MPYYFQQANSVGSIAKTSPKAQSISRGCILDSKNSEFIYTIGDITVDNNSIDFVKTKNKTKYNNIDTLNTTLITEPFILKDNSEIKFSECFSTADSILAAKTLEDTGYVNYKIELIDNSNDKTIGIIRDFKINSTNLRSSELSYYRLNTEGLGNKTVILKLLVSTNIDKPKLSLVNSYADTSVMAKMYVKDISINGVEVIKNYSLGQNYPNPFNPTTTIRYQLPKEGMVTLKVYDVLGREVATLVNGFKTGGSYIVNFNASELASGVYIYQIRVNDASGSNGYTSTKKLILLK